MGSSESQLKAELVIDMSRLADEISKKILENIKSMLDKKHGSDEVIFSVEDLAEYLRVSPKWVYSHKHELPCFKLVGLLRFRKKEIDRIIDKLALRENLKKQPQSNIS